MYKIAMNILTISTVAVTLSACAPSIWNKAGASEQDFKRVLYSCKRDAAQSTSIAGPFADAIIVAMDRRNMIEECLSANGWEKQ